MLIINWKNLQLHLPSMCSSGRNIIVIDLAIFKISVSLQVHVGTNPSNKWSSIFLRTYVHCSEHLSEEMVTDTILGHGDRSTFWFPTGLRWEQRLRQRYTIWYVYLKYLHIGQTLYTDADSFRRTIMYLDYRR